MVGFAGVLEHRQRVRRASRWLVEGGLIGVVVLAGLVAVGPPAPEDRDQVRAYVGRSMWSAAGGAAGFLDTRLVKRGLERLGAADRRALARLDVGSEVLSDGDFVFAPLCRHHCCPCEPAVVVANVATGEVGVALSRESATWIWRGRRTRVAPEEFPCDVLRRVYDPTMSVPPRDLERCRRTINPDEIMRLVKP
jgi:hypothetical protein